MKITAEFDSLEELHAFVEWKAGRAAAAQKTPVQGSGLDHRMIQALLAEQIAYVEDAQALPDDCILKMGSIGRTSLARLKAWKRAGPNV